MFLTLSEVSDPLSFVDALKIEHIPRAVTPTSYALELKLNGILLPTTLTKRLVYVHFVAT